MGSKKWLENLLTYRIGYPRTIVDDVQFYPPIVGAALHLNTNGTGTTA